MNTSKASCLVELLTSLLLVVACAGGGESTTSSPATTQPPPITLAPAATSVPEPPSTTSPEPVEPDAPSGGFDAPILIANADGVFEVDTEGAAFQLVDGSVAYAIDDTGGGLLYQVDRGRDWEAFFGGAQEGRSTVVWWIPRGAAAPQELLVPDEARGQALTLHDTYATAASFAVVYQRHEGTAPPFDSDTKDTLRIYDVATGKVSELMSVGGWEWTLGPVSAGSDYLVATEHQMLGSGCRLVDREGDPAALTGVPSAGPSCFDDTTECPTGCALSSDASSVAFLEWGHTGAADGTPWQIGLARVAAVADPVEFAASSGGRWSPADLDVAGDQVIVNRTWEGSYVEPALVFDAAHPEATPIELPVAGVARFAARSVDIAGPVRLGGSAVGAPNHYRAGPHGLTRFVDGIETVLVEEAVGSVWDDRLGGFVFVTDDQIARWWRAGEAEPIDLADLDPGNEGYRHVFPTFVGVMAGQPHVFYESWIGDTAGHPLSCDDFQLVGRSLVTNAVSGFMCLPIVDAGYDIRSVGADVFVGMLNIASGSSGTSVDLRFWNAGGVEISHAHNPLADSCEPCHANALISPDGGSLAYALWPTAMWPPQEWDLVDPDEWWEQSEHIPTRVTVLALSDGAVRWETDAPAGSRLSDFDGRYLVVEHGWPDPVAVIYDSWDIHEPTSVPGRAALVRPALAGHTPVELP